MDERTGGPSGRSAALRDLLWILLAVLLLMVLGSATRLFEPFYDWVGERLRGQVGEAVGALVLLAAGLSLFALLQGRSNRQETRRAPGGEPVPGAPREDARCSGRRRRDRVLAGSDVRRHRAPPGRGTPPCGRGAIPGDRRARPRRDLRRRARRQHAEPVREPPDRADHGLHAGGVHRAARAVARAHAR